METLKVFLVSIRSLRPRKESCKSKYIFLKLSFHSMLCIPQYIHLKFSLHIKLSVYCLWNCLTSSYVFPFRCIAKNYTRIKDVEKELAGLQFQLKLTSGPKRSALEMLRKKIELQSERVIAARDRFHSSRKVNQATLHSRLKTYSTFLYMLVCKAADRMLVKRPCLTAQTREA